MKGTCVQMKGRWEEMNAHWNEHERIMKGKWIKMNTNERNMTGKWKEVNAQWKEDMHERISNMLISTKPWKAIGPPDSDNHNNSNYSKEFDGSSYLYIYIHNIYIHILYIYAMYIYIHDWFLGPHLRGGMEVCCRTTWWVALRATSHSAREPRTMCWMAPWLFPWRALRAAYKRSLKVRLRINYSNYLS